MTDTLVLLKFGGSLITDKSEANTANHNQIDELAQELRDIHNANPNLPLIIGHGSGSFGHIAADQYHTRDGVHSCEDWQGFAEVWKAAHTLHSIMMTAFEQAWLPVISFSPSAMVMTENRNIIEWNLKPLKSALRGGLIPVIFGDVVFDTQMGGTILSTEELFLHLSRQLFPQKILLAGRAEGVFADFPVCNQLISKITPLTLEQYSDHIDTSRNIDVTGGMRSKVTNMLRLAETQPGLEIHIFSGINANNLRKILAGEKIGTLITADETTISSR